MRPATACHQCRIHRRRCRAVSGESACTRCQSLNLACSLHHILSRPTSNQAQQHRLSPRWGATSPEQDQYSTSLQQTSPSRSFNDRELRNELVSQYFKHIHDKHHSLFHRPSVEGELSHGTLPELLVFAMMALGARFSEASKFEGTNPRRRGQDYAEKAAGLLNITDISLTTIQACILLGTISFAELRMETEALYYSVASRLALLLDLPHRHCSTEIEKQVHLRVWWTLYMIDVWNSTGLHLPRQFAFSEHVPFPLEESIFLHLPTNDDSQRNSTHRTSIWGAMALLAYIWAEIHEVNKASVAGLTSPEDLNSSIATLSAKLQNWSASLPPYLTCNPKNLYHYASLGLGSAFAALHLGYHYYNEVLFYQFLSPASCHPVIATAHFSSSCKLHARLFCDLLYLCNSRADCTPLFLMVGHMLVVTSTVYMHSLLFSSFEEEIATARSRLEHNFEILTKLQGYWVALDLSLSRLKAFHVCRISSEQSFRMDRWMLSFLLEHGVPVADKFVLQDGNGQTGAVSSTTTVAALPVISRDGLLETTLDASSSPKLTMQEWFHKTFVA